MRQFMQQFKSVKLISVVIFGLTLSFSGGTTMIEGLPERLEKELRVLAPKTVRVKDSSPS
eukprot:gnl/Chilomastix_caulleri/6150.p2 GENE.gnl/Chilomastix_caulleri/6150~~gnl/Chilomastix_caulleri/6150.p2  ORF type:complete len:60 (+),score=18.04 gnl/Chilomastix_caulleri/6150:148-327(+)